MSIFIFIFLCLFLFYILNVFRFSALKRSELGGLNALKIQAENRLLTITGKITETDQSTENELINIIQSINNLRAGELLQVETASNFIKSDTIIYSFILLFCCFPILLLFLNLRHNRFIYISINILTLLLKFEDHDNCNN